MPFPFDAVNRAIANIDVAAKISDALLALARAGGAGVKANDRLTDILFGLGGLGDVHLTANTPGYSGLKDCRTFVVDAAVTVSPLPGQFLFVRARESIVWNGTWLADGTFPNFGPLITFGSPAQSGGGGGGGGGDSGATFGQDGQSNNFGGGGGGGGNVGYQQGTNGAAGAGGMHGSPGNPGGDGVLGTPGLVDLYQQQTTLSEYPGVVAAMSGCLPGIPGQQGAQGGQGANVGMGSGQGGQGGQGGPVGGAAGGFMILAAPSLTIGKDAVFQAKGLPGMQGTVGSDGGDAPVGSAGGGGAGGGGGSGSQGGSGGIVLAFYHDLSLHPLAVFLLDGGLGGPRSAGGVKGLGDPPGVRDGARGGLGQDGPAGTKGFYWGTKILAS